MNEEGGVSNEVLEIAEALLQLDPVRTYPQRGAKLVADVAHIHCYRLDFDGPRPAVVSDRPPPMEPPLVSLPLRHGRETIGTLHLYASGQAPLGSDELRLARWAARVFARGMSYATRLSDEGSRRSGEEVREALERAPLTPRERDVAALVVAGASTRDIAQRTALTVSTVNTYLKRIFAKLGVHSRVELVAKLAGTVGMQEADEELHDAAEGSSARTGDETLEIVPS